MRPTLTEGPPVAIVTETLTVGPTVTVIERIKTTPKESGGDMTESAVAGAAVLAALSGATTTVAGIRKDRRRPRSRRR
ncbi:hypothetical protein [Streptomyces sp. NPDC058613]|uniref:hypothetical protein n=1 Tax=Streptomyces sp. NPDC058613 TaxID=3346556 RepID=UPI0036499611